MSKGIVGSLLVGSVVAALSMPVFAGDDSGKVNFTGRILADTCEINVDDSGSNEGTVTFADTYPSDYDGNGSVGTSKAFKIEVKKCDPLIAKLNLRFNGTTSDPESLRLVNDLSGAGNATNIGISVKNENGTTSNVKFDGSDPDSGTDVANDATGEAASVFNYTANVIQVGDNLPTAGKYSASASFEVVYR